METKRLLINDAVTSPYMDLKAEETKPASSLGPNVEKG